MNGFDSCDPERVVVIAVEFMDGQRREYHVSCEVPWRVDVPSNCLVIGRDMTRTHIPLGNVREFGPIERYVAPF